MDLRSGRRNQRKGAKAQRRNEVVLRSKCVSIVSRELRETCFHVGFFKPTRRFLLCAFAPLRLCVNFLILSLSSSFLFAADAVSQARRGVAEYEKQNYDAALEAFRKAAEQDPESPEIQFDLGTTLAKKGKFAPSREALQKSLAGESRVSKRDAHYNLGYSRVMEAMSEENKEMKPEQRLGLLREGLESFREAILADPKDRDAKYNFETTRRIIKRIEEQMQQQQQQSQDQKQEGDKKEGDPKSEGSGGGKDSQPNKDSKGDSKDSQSQSKDGESKDNQGEKDQEKNEGKEEGEKSPSESGEESKDEEKSSPKQQEQGMDEKRDSTQEKPKEGKQEQPKPDGKPNQGSRNKPGEAKNGASASAAHAEGTPPPLTPEEIDAMRVLNSLQEQKPEQFKKLFRFQGKSTGKTNVKDW